MGDGSAERGSPFAASNDHAGRDRRHLAARLNEVGIVVLLDTRRQIGRFERSAERNGQEMDARICRNCADERIGLAPNDHGSVDRPLLQPLDGCACIEVLRLDRDAERLEQGGCGGS